MSEHIITGVVAGSFDVIHPGYIYMFNECKKHCDELLVLLHDDPSQERPHKLKPILSLEERQLVLRALRPVDRIMTYQSEEDLYQLLSTLSIGVRFLGDDYQGRSFTGDDLDIPIHYLTRDHGWSTTRFKKEIAASLVHEVEH